MHYVLSPYRRGSRVRAHRAPECIILIISARAETRILTPGIGSFGIVLVVCLLVPSLSGAYPGEATSQDCRLLLEEGVSVLPGYSKMIDRQLCLNAGCIRIRDGGICTCAVDGRYLLSSYARYIFFFSLSFLLYVHVIKNIVIGQKRLIGRSIHHAEQQIAMKFQAFTIFYRYSPDTVHIFRANISSMRAPAYRMQCPEFLRVRHPTGLSLLTREVTTTKRKCYRVISSTKHHQKSLLPTIIALENHSKSFKIDRLPIASASN